MSTIVNFSSYKTAASEGWGNTRFMDYTDDSCMNAKGGTPGNVVVLSASLPGGTESDSRAWPSGLQLGSLHLIVYNGHAGLGGN